ncbi:MAG: translocation/assembly module TamB domain-containing protein, partial [Sediminibacterium sp.]
MYKANLKKIPGIVLKALFWVVVSLVGLLVLVWILIRFQFVQDYAKNKTITYLNQKLGTKVSIGGLSIDFPNRVVLKNFYFEDQQKDTLLAGQRLLIDISMLGILKNRVAISNLELENVHANILRNRPDSVFNFEYIAKAFESSSEKTKAPKDSSAPMIFQMGAVQLKNIQFRFKDQLAGIDTRVSLGLLKTNIQKIAPETSKYATGPVLLNQVLVSFIDSSAALSSNVNVQEMKLHVGELDLGHLLIPINQLKLDGANIAVKIGKQTKIKQVNQANKLDTTKSPFWQVLANNIDLTNTNIQFDDEEHPIQKYGLDYFHISVKDLLLHADSIDFSENNYAGKIQQMHFKEQSGLSIVAFGTQFSYTSKEAFLKGFNLKTDKTHIQTDLKLQYNSTASLAKEIGACKLDLNLKESKLAISDLLMVVPDLQKQLAKQQDKVISAGGIVKGSISSLNISEFHASGVGKTALQLRGQIKGLPNLEKTYFQLPMISLSTTSKDIQAILPPKSIPTAIKLPATMRVKGSFNGTMNSFSTKLLATTSMGIIQLNGSMSLSQKTYDAKIDLSRVELGKFLKNDSLFGQINMHGQVKGKGYDYKTLQANLQTSITSFLFKGYNYQNLEATAALNQGNMQLKAAMVDPNLTFDMDAQAALKQGFPALKLSLLIDTMNFKALHLTTDSFSMHSKFKVDFSNTHPDSLVGEAFISQIRFSRGSRHFSSDTARVKADMQGEDNQFTLFSKPLIAAINGRYRLTELSTALQHHFNQYYHIQNFTDTVFIPQDWKASFQFRTSPIVLQFLPELKGTDTMGATMQFVSDRNILNFNLNAPLIQYDGSRIRQLQANISTGDTAMLYGLNFENAAVKNLLLNNASLNGRISNNTIYGNLIFRNKLFEKLYQLSLSMQQQNKGTRFHLNPDSLLLNSQSWQVDPLNSIYYDSAGIVASNVGLQYKDQSISVNNRSNNPSSPIDLLFKNFSIRTLTDMIRQDSIGAEGIINGQAVLMLSTKKPVFTSDIHIKDLAYHKTLIGDLDVKVDNESAKRFRADLELNGIGTHATVKGFYDTESETIDMQLLMDSLNMASIIPFSAGQIRDAGGKLQANFHLTGNLDEPRLNGDMLFNNAFITPTMLGQKFQLENEKLLITENGLTFDQLTLKDSLGKSAVLNGTIQTKDLQQFGLDLSLVANDFSLVNSTQADNQLFFGKLNIDADVTLKGNLDNLDLNARLKANKLTDLNVVLPSSDPELQSREGVVNFIDSKKIKDSVIQINFSDTLVQRLSLIKGINLSATIETDTAANFTLIIDSRTGDALTVRGKSSLSAGLDESGKLSLTGIYEVQKGSYQISFNLLKKKFEIVKGSTITWTGDPMSAIVDIKAMYATKASPIDLVESELGGLSNTELNK